MSTLPFFRPGRPAWLGGILALVVMGARADFVPPGQAAFTIEVPGERLAVDEVREVILRASIGRCWEVKEDAEKRVVVYLKHRKNEATVTYEFDERTVAAYCEGYATNRKGVRKGREQPTGWLKFLRRDIVKGLNEAAFLTKK